MLFKILISRFSTCSYLHKEIATNLKGKNVTAQGWLKRQLSDPYVKKAKYHNFRCRSAFKLLQIDDKYNLLHPGQTVIDCGAAPGSWCQVAAVRTNSTLKDSSLPQGKVIGIDIVKAHPVEGVTFITPYDFTEQSTQEKILELLNGDKADIMLSDMAPNATGMKDFDHDKLVDLLIVFIRFAVLNTKYDGTCLLKVFNGRRLSEIENVLKKFYKNVKLMKPDASRSDSSEIYCVARNFKGVKLNKQES